MKNREIYAKTLRFSLLQILVDLLGLLIAIAIPAVAFLVTRGKEDVCVAATAICAVVGIVAGLLFAKYAGYLFKAGQIAMVTQAVATGQLPENVVEAGKQAVKSRFLTANVYFGLTSLISGINAQLTRGITGATETLGKMTGNDNAGGVVEGIGAAISIFISVVLEYISCCCLGWVFYNKDQNAFKSTCDGAVIYFQNGKVLMKNMGKVIGISLLCFVLIGGGLFAGLNAVIGDLPALFTAEQLAQMEMDLTPGDVRYILIGVLALIGWGILHAALVKPYLLVSVMRDYLNAAAKTPPAVDIYGKLCKLSGKFRKAYAKSGAEQPAQPAEA